MEKKMDTQLEKLERFYWTYISQKRKDNLLALCPEIFESKSVLYVGARPSRADFLDDFHKNGCGITILEIYPENAEYFKKFPWLEVVEGDVRNFFTDRKFDTIFWWHGPEHIEERDLEMTLKKIESFANKFVVLGCPWGMVPQWKSLEKNPFEEHKAFFDTGYFERLGYKTDYSGVKGRMGSNIISYKRM